MNASHAYEARFWYLLGVFSLEMFPEALFFIFIGEYLYRDLIAVKNVTIGDLFIWENFTLTKDIANHFLPAHFASGP